MITVHIDFETRSNIDLKKTSTQAYADDLSTDVWCMAYAVDDGPVSVWTPGDAFPAAIDDAMLRAWAFGEDDIEFVAHNASFEIIIWGTIMSLRYGWPPIPLTSWRCTMAQAHAMSLPASLENAAGALSLSVKKDMEGRRLMQQMASPRRIDEDGTLHWWDDAGRRNRLYDYCRNDVVVERELDKKMLRLSPSELALWHLDQRINGRGIYVDVPTINAAISTIDSEKQRLNKEMRDATFGYVNTTSAIIDLADFCRFHGADLEGVAKAEVTRLLKKPDLHPDVRNALLVRQEAAKSSTAKLTAMAKAVSLDGRVRGTMQYHGANTGRWAGRRIQPHNFPRPKLKHDEIVKALAYLSQPDILTVFYGRPLDLISSALRAMIMAAPGRVLTAADLSAIEARGIGWLAGQEEILNIFREGKDIYKYAAAGIFGVAYEDVTDDQRQVGKVAILALGYGGGVGAFQTMAKGYNVDVGQAFDVLYERALLGGGKMIERAEGMYDAHCKEYPDELHPHRISYESFVAADLTKQFWRLDNPKIVTYWYDLENAAIAAIQEPGRAFTAGEGHAKVYFKCNGSFLFLRLPSGRVLTYPYPQVKEAETPWGGKKLLPHYMAINPDNNQWELISTYGGSLAENVTQAMCRDILAEAMVRVDAAGYNIVFHVHDELVCEEPLDHGSVEELVQLMTVQPSWAPDLPIAANGWRGERYRK